MKRTSRHLSSILSSSVKSSIRVGIPLRSVVGVLLARFVHLGVSSVLLSLLRLAEGFFGVVSSFLIFGVETFLGLGLFLLGAAGVSAVVVPISASGVVSGSTLTSILLTGVNVEPACVEAVSAIKGCVMVSAIVGNGYSDEDVNKMIECDVEEC